MDVTLVGPVRVRWGGLRWMGPAARTPDRGGDRAGGDPPGRRGADDGAGRRRRREPDRPRGERPRQRVDPHLEPPGVGAPARAERDRPADLLYRSLRGPHGILGPGRDESMVPVLRAVGRAPPRSVAGGGVPVPRGGRRPFVRSGPARGPP